MEKLLKDLAWKCYENELNFQIYSHGSIDVYHHTEDEAIMVSEGLLKGYEKFEKPVDVLKRMHKEVDDYLEPIEYEEIEPDETEIARANLTEYERKMKEAGHKQSDFM